MKITNMASSRLTLSHMAVLKMKTLSMLEFNRILDHLSHEDSICHLFIVDIKFHNRNPNMMLFNEIYPPIFQKNKTVRAHETSTVHLISVLSRNEQRGIINSLKCSAKTHSKLDEKISFPVYNEHLHFLIKRAGWFVTSIYEHLNFE